MFFQSSSFSFIFHCSYIYLPSSIVYSYLHTFIFHLSLCIPIPPSSTNVPMSKNESNVSITGFGTSGFVLRRNKIIECFCHDNSVFCTITDVNNVNYGRKFWGCRNYINHMTRSVISSSG